MVGQMAIARALPGFNDLGQNMSNNMSNNLLFSFCKQINQLSFFNASSFKLLWSQQQILLDTYRTL